MSILFNTIYCSQAEKDRELRAIRKLQLEEEAAIMKNVPEWKVGASVFKFKAE
ncbi:hypothetical protein EON65_04920 [archaeon]|nr:MAG: hypothetical protein EON65_04920 [archaeon]